MANPKTFTKQSIITTSDQDALQIKNVEGTVVGWIDSTGTGQGNLASGGGGQGAFPSTSTDSWGISNLSSGDNSLYTVPSGKLAIFRPFYFNTTVGTINVFPTISPSGSGITYRAGATLGLTASGVNGSDGSTQTQANIVASAGDVIGVNCASTGINCYGTVLLADISNTSTYKQVFLNTFSVGDNTVYTVPMGKIAYIGYGSFSALGTFGTQLFYSNESGAGVTVSINFVPSSGIVANTNRMFAPASVASASTFTPSAVKKLSAGDVVSINTSSNGKQFFTFPVLEMSL